MKNNVDLESTSLRFFDAHAAYPTSGYCSPSLCLVHPNRSHICGAYSHFECETQTAREAISGKINMRC